MKVACSLLILFVIGCSNTKYSGWDKVRIVNEPPESNCNYILQEICYEQNAYEGCMNYFRKKAAKAGGNRVIVTKASDYVDKSIIADIYQCQ